MAGERRKVKGKPGGGRNARRWWNYNVPRREPWPDSERPERKQNMQMFRSVGVGVILSICSGLGSSLLATYSKITALELDVAVMKSQVQALTRQR